MKLLRTLLSPLYTKISDDVKFISISTKVLFVFIFFLIVSNFTTNYLNLLLNRNLIINQSYNAIKATTFDIYSYSNLQYNFYVLSRNIGGTLELIREHSKTRLNNKSSLALGLNMQGQVLFDTKEGNFPSSASQKAQTNDNNNLSNPQEQTISPLTLQDQIKNFNLKIFEDTKVFQTIKENVGKVVYEDFINFRYHNTDYIGSYYYSPKWNWIFISAESKDFFYQQTQKIFTQISLLIVGIIISFSIIGIMTFQFLFRFLNLITQNMLHMNKSKELSLIDLKNASNDDISFLGITFNSLSQTVNSLLSIFTKFTSKEVVLKAYQEGKVELQGESQELTCLFSDIRSFTTITEILKVDIVKLLNIHYDYAIKEISKNEGVVASIIGDAILAVFGVLPPITNKSYDALISGFTIQHSVEMLRKKITQEKNLLIGSRHITPDEEKRINSLLLEVGVGIDGGDVFYGNIGSLERMTNTVIGDSVNSAARLEGLTRIYHVPIVCSEFIKNDIETNIPNHEFFFMEIDQVKVKGKNEGKKVYWPMIRQTIPFEIKLEIKKYQEALFCYYDGYWEKSLQLFRNCSLPCSSVFIERMSKTKKPLDWNGLWNMESK
jgi:adenylate cyclase